MEAIMGITPEFSFGDKIWAILFVVWNFGWWIFFLIVTLLNFVHPFANAWWAHFWKIYVWIPFIGGIPATIIFTIGGVRDLKALFQLLNATVRDHSDDGRVSHHTDEVLEETPRARETTANI
jgi:hypothetical protein